MEKQRIEYYASQIVDSGYRVHKELGPGLLESVCLLCHMEELTRRGIKAEQERKFTNEKPNKLFTVSYSLFSDRYSLFTPVNNAQLPVNREQITMNSSSYR